MSVSSVVYGAVVMVVGKHDRKHYQPRTELCPGSTLANTDKFNMIAGNQGPDSTAHVLKKFPSKQDNT